MEPIALNAEAESLLERARGGTGTAGRAAHKVAGGPSTEMTHAMVALTASHKLEEHENPGEATVQVLIGRIVVKSGDESVKVEQGELYSIPPARHSVEALDDSVFLLTSVKLRSAPRPTA